MSLTAHIPAATLWIQGLGVLVPGVYGIFRPQTVIDSIGDFAFGGNPDKLVVSMSLMMLITMGSYFSLAAAHPRLHRKALVINVPLRILATGLFWRHGPEARSLAIMELTWAAINAAAVPFTKS